MLSVGKDDIVIHSILQHAIKTLALLLADGQPGMDAEIERVIRANPKKFLWDALDILQKKHMEELESQPEPRPEFMRDCRENLHLTAISKEILSGAARNRLNMHEFANRFLDRYDKRRRKISAKKYAKAALLAILLSAGITVVGVEGVRVKFLNLVMEAGEKATGLIFDTDSEYMSDEIELSYIPEGFELQEKDIQEGYLYLKFKKKELYFTIQMLEEHKALHIDTEDAEVGKTTINGNEAIYSYKDEVGTIVFHDEHYAYTVFGNLPREQLIDIAEGIQYKG